MAVRCCRQCVSRCHCVHNCKRGLVITLLDKHQTLMIGGPEVAVQQLQAELPNMHAAYRAATSRKVDLWGKEEERAYILRPDNKCQYDIIDQHHDCTTHIHKMCSETAYVALLSRVST